MFDSRTTLKVYGSGIAIAGALAVCMWIIPTNDVERIVRECSGKAFDAKTVFSEKENCYAEVLRAYALENGPEKTFEILPKIQELDIEIVPCHFIGHNIGYGVYERSPETWVEDFRNISQECNYGAMHGILELAIADVPGGLTQELLPSICGEKPRGDCNHIVGHLALIETAGSIKDALALCDVFKNSSQYDHCSSGVFMEFETAINLVTHGITDESVLDWGARLPELESVCRMQETRDYVQCWRVLAHVFADVASFNPQNTFALCQNSENEAARRACSNLATGILVTRPGISPEERLEVCDFSPSGKVACYAHAVMSLSAISQRDTSSVNAFCGLVPDADAPPECSKKK